ncbi:MAG: replicative DNA helicase [Acidobacteriota bacterium]
MTTEQPPSSIEAERALLGAVLLDEHLLDEAREAVGASDFHHGGHRKIFETLCAMSDGGSPIDTVTLCERMKGDGTLERAGGPLLVAQLHHAGISLSSVEGYTKILRGKSITRQVIAICRDMASRGQSGSESGRALLEAAEQAIFRLGRETSGPGFVPARDLLLELHADLTAQERGGLRGIESGYPELDEMTRGWQPGAMIVVAGRPGMGKTSLGLDFARHAALRQQKVVGILSMEMSGRQIVQRLVSQEARVDTAEMDSGKLDEKDWKKMAGAMGRLGERIYIDDTPGLTAPQMRSKARRLKHLHGLDLLVVDYIQLAMADPNRKKENRQQEISAVSRTVKALAMELDIPVIALSQLNRQVEGRKTSKRPLLSDLRESGAIEQDADQVLMIYRETVYADGEQGEGPDCGVADEAEILVRKNRTGRTGKIRLDFLPFWTTFQIK